MAFVAALLFLLSCAISVAVAPDKLTALNHAALLALGLFATWVLSLAAHRLARGPVLGTAGVVCAVLAALISLYTGIARYTPAMLPNWAVGDTVNDNVLASGLVVLIPLVVLGVGYFGGWKDFREQRRRHRHRYGFDDESTSKTEERQASSARTANKPVQWRRWLFGAIALFTAMLLLMSLVALTLTDSRAGALGLGVGALAGAWIALRRRLPIGRSVRTGGDILVAAMPLALAGIVLLALLIPSFDTGPLGSSVVAGSTGTRAGLWRDGLSLARDYRFTGVGFGATMMALSTYVYLLHVGFIGHVHNFLIELTIEQGLVGLIGYVFLLISASWSLIRAYRKRSVPRWMVGAIAASLIGMLVHGLFDGGPYVSRLSPLVFLPLGFAWGAAPPEAALRTLMPQQLAWRSLAVLAPLVAVLLLFAWPGARGAMQANLGAVEQSSRELALYTWRVWGIQDQLRRSPAVDLDEAVARYAAALAYDPQNATAYRRLGQIALSRGDVDLALRYLTEAYRSESDDRATRLLLGDAYALNGQVQEAADLWLTVDTEAGELQGRQWWVSQSASPEQQAAYAAAQALK